jgi:glyceraldehyde 3-phosphate dehydrogenase
MALRVGVNGFGRIGRLFLRAAMQGELGHANDPHNDPPIEVTAINDLCPAATNAHLLKYDSTFGVLKETVSHGDDSITVAGHTIKVLQERDPKALPWAELGVDVVVEATGLFTEGGKARAHIEAGARRVVITAPGTDVDATFVIGVNDGTFNPANHLVVSNASCTTNCFVPMVKVLDDAFGVERGLMTTVHAYTNDQSLLDLAHRDLRRARASAVNIVPTSTGAARVTGLVLQAMQGRLDGTSLRVPIPDGSITDFTAILKREATVDEVNEAFRSAAREGPLARVLDFTEEPLVSSDIVGCPASCIFDSKLTMAMGPLVKVFGWYDNEWGYANRVLDLVRLVGSA